MILREWYQENNMSGKENSVLLLTQWPRKVLVRAVTFGQQRNRLDLVMLITKGNTNFVYHIFFKVHA